MRDAWLASSCWLVHTAHLEALIVVLRLAGRAIIARRSRWRSTHWRRRRHVWNVCSETESTSVACVEPAIVRVEGEGRC